MNNNDQDTSKKASEGGADSIISSDVVGGDPTREGGANGGESGTKIPALQDTNATTVANSNAANDDPESPVGEKTAFPLLLHEIVSDPTTDDLIHWLPCGTRFTISDKTKFAERVLPRFFGHAKFTSFTRRLKRWSFTRVPSGPFMGSYYNVNFRRGEHELAARVRYDHPAALSGAAMQLSKQRNMVLHGGLGLNAMGLGNVMANGMFINPLVAASMGGGIGVPQQLQQQQQMMSNEDILLTQMYMMNMAAQAAGNGGGNSLLQAMGQNNINPNMMLQQQMAQQMGQQGSIMNPNLDQLQQQNLLQQRQQLHQQWNNSQQGRLGQGHGQGQGQQMIQGQGGNIGGGGQQQTPDDQQLLAAMYLEHLNKQQQAAKQVMNSSTITTSNTEQQSPQVVGGGSANNPIMGGNPNPMGDLLANYLRRNGGAPPPTNGVGGGDGGGGGGFLYGGNDGSGDTKEEEGLNL